VLDELSRVLVLLDRAKTEPEEDMAPSASSTRPDHPATPLARAEPGLKSQAWERIKASFTRRLDDRRPLVGLYICEALERAWS